MKSLLKKKLSPIVGLDIGTRQIKAVLIEQSGEGFSLQGFACEPIIKSAFAEREIKDFEAVSLALKRVHNALKSKIKPVAIAVAGSSVISKIVYMAPDQSDYELEAQIEIEADSLIPYPLDEVYLDFEELGTSKTQAGKVDVLLSAAHKDMVDSRITLVREVPFEPRIVDIEGYALGNALSAFYRPGDGEATVCCINIGASLLQLCIWKDNEVIYAKEHAFGMNKLHQDLAAVYMIDAEEAEKQLLMGALSPTWEQDILPVFTANLQQQINKVLQIYMSALHAKRPQRILLAGGGATLPLLVDNLGQDLGIDITIFNPFSAMTINHKLDAERLTQIAPQLAIAAGLASRSFSQCHV